jgi:hypothetical protein
MEKRLAASKKEDFVYTHRFTNHPDLVAVFGEIGPGAILEHLRTAPRLAEWIASGRNLALELVELLDFAILDRCANIGAADMTPERLNDVAAEVFRAVPSMKQDTTQGFIDCAQYLVMRYCGLISVIDAGGPEAAAFLKSRCLDWERLEALERAKRENDPASIAMNVVVGLMRGDLKTYRLLEKSLEKIIAKELRRDVTWLHRQDEQSFWHVRDWISSAVANGASWLSNLNEDGCPKKLAKCGSLSALVAEADKQMGKELAKGRRGVAQGEEVFAEDDGVFHVVRLMTPAALDRESDAMRHCIGHGGYDRLLKEDSHLYLSLRDRFGKPHATIEVVKEMIVQFQGKANTPPKDEYRDATLRLLSPLGIEFHAGASILDNPALNIDFFAAPPVPYLRFGEGRVA